MPVFGKKPPPPHEDYSVFIYDVLLRAVEYIQSKYPFFTFIGAFENVSPYIQQDIVGGQQVMDPERLLNIQLEEKRVTIYIPNPTTVDVVRFASRALEKILKVAPQITFEGEKGGVANLHQIYARAPEKIYEYNITCYSYLVPSPYNEGEQVPGTQLILSFAASLPL